MNKILIYLPIMLTLNSCSSKLDLLEQTVNMGEFTTEVQLQKEEIVQEINQFYKSGEEGTFYGVDSIAIYYKVFVQDSLEKGAILISSGRTECVLRYKELIFDLYQNGYSVYIYDHRGQGLSGRMTSEYELGYVVDFQDYILDMKQFYDLKLRPNHHKKTYLLAHSMGGAIGMTYLMQNTKDFDAACFSAPMFGLSNVQCLLGKLFDRGKFQYAISQGNYEKNKESFEENTISNSKIRFDRSSFESENAPMSRLGGVSFTWLNQSCKQFTYLFNNIDLLNTPCLIFSPDEEKIVDPKAHFKFVKEAKRLEKEVEGYAIHHAQHALFIERDKARNLTLSASLDFFNKY